MVICWKGKSYHVPLNFEKGTAPQVINEEEAKGYYTCINDELPEETFHQLKPQEYYRIWEFTLQYAQCPICEERIYCAENMCDCT